MPTLCKTNDRSFARHFNRFVSERNRPVVVEQTQFFSTLLFVAGLKVREYLLWSKFLRELYIFVDRWKNRRN